MSCLLEITLRLLKKQETNKDQKDTSLKTLERKVEILNRKMTSDALSWNVMFGCRTKFKKEKVFILK